MRSVPSAGAKAGQLERERQVLALPAPCVAEVLRGASLGDSQQRRQTEELLEQLEILPLDGRSARAAGLLSADCLRRGKNVPILDCLMAAIAAGHEATLITRDADFARIPGLAVETY